MDRLFAALQRIFKRKRKKKSWTLEDHTELTCAEFEAHLAKAGVLQIPVDKPVSICQFFQKNIESPDQIVKGRFTVIKHRPAKRTFTLESSLPDIHLDRNSMDYDSHPLHESIDSFYHSTLHETSIIHSKESKPPIYCDHACLSSDIYVESQPLSRISSQKMSTRDRTMSQLSLSSLISEDSPFHRDTSTTVTSRSGRLFTLERLSASAEDSHMTDSVMTDAEVVQIGRFIVETS
jgi:hypothetical protein